MGTLNMGAELEKRFQNSMNNPPFCPDCGSLTLVKEIPSRYNTQTGERTFYFVSRCPNRRWYSSSHQGFQLGSTNRWEENDW